MDELTESEIEAKCRDITILVEMYKTIVLYEKHELGLRDALIKIGDIAGNQNNTFIYSDEKRRYIRNKYGYIRSKNVDTAGPRENGIHFEKLHKLKVVLEEKPEFKFADDESDRVKSDLAGLKEKIKHILLSEEEFIQTKDDLKCLINPLNLYNNLKMSNIIAIATKYYDQHILTKIKLELDNFDSKKFNFEVREDRYCFARKCVIIGKLFEELMVDASDEFEQFTKIRSVLMHSHEILSAGLNKQENNSGNLNENIKKIVECMSNMIQSDDKNCLFINYADKKTAYCLRANSQKVLKVFQKENRSHANSAHEANEPKAKQKPDKNSPKSILLIFDTAFKLLENIYHSTENNKYLADLNTKYQESLKKLKKSEKIDYVGYPDHLGPNNKETIGEIAEQIKKAAQGNHKQQEAGSKSLGLPEEIELSLIVINILRNIDQELAYLFKVEHLGNISTKKDYVIDHIIATIDEYQRELGSTSIAELISQISGDNRSPPISVEAIELKLLIERDIVPAREHFKTMLASSEQNHTNIPESMRKLSELAKWLSTLGLCSKAIDYWKRIIEHSEEHYQALAEKNCRCSSGPLDIHQMLFGMELYCFNAHIELASIHLVYERCEAALEMILPLTNRIIQSNNFSAIRNLGTPHRDYSMLESANILLLTGLCFVDRGFYKEAIILLENAKELLENMESFLPLFYQIQLRLAKFHHAISQRSDAISILEDILNQNNLHPIVEVTSIRLYTTLLTEINETNLIYLKRKCIDRARAVSKRISNKEKIVENEYFIIELEVILMELETLIEDSKLVHIGLGNRSLSDLQIELKNLEKRSIQIISECKNGFNFTGLIPIIYAQIALSYAGVIDKMSNFESEKPKYDKAKSYFNVIKKEFDALNFPSWSLKYAFRIVLQAVSSACNNFAYAIDDIELRIKYLEEGSDTLRFIFSSDLKLEAPFQEIFSDQMCLRLGNTGIEYFNLGNHLLSLNRTKFFDDAFNCFKNALKNFSEMLKIYPFIKITKPGDFEYLKCFASSYLSAGFLRYNLSFIRKAMMFYDEALEEWEDSEEIIERKEGCRQVISDVRFTFEQIQNGLNTKLARELDSFGVYELHLCFSEAHLYALTFYSENLKKKLLIHDFKRTVNRITLYLYKSNIDDLKNHIKREFQFIDNIETQRCDESKTFNFTYNKSSNDVFTLNDQTEQMLKATNKKGIDHYRANEFDKAIEKYTECLEWLGKIPECSKKVEYKLAYFFNRARAHHKKGDLLAAMCDYHATLKLNNAHEKASKYLKSCVESDFQAASKENEEKKLIRLLANGINIGNKF